MTEVRHTTIAVGDIEMAVTEAGSGPPVLLLHGFPELAYSWRHQFGPLAAAGHRVIAPDMRGFGGTSAPEPIEAYDVLALTGDVTRLLDALGLDEAILVGHDWGADVAWKTALIHPGRVRAVAGLSVPYAPRSAAEPTPILRRLMGEDFYMLWFQAPGVAEAALERDVRRTLLARKLWGPAWARRDDVDPRPEWLTEADLDLYVETFARTGFRGGLNWYRNLDRNWRVTEPYAERRIDQPALFVTGERDPVRAFMPHQVMEGWVTDLRETVIVPDAGHWIQQERPEVVNEALLRWLGDVG